MSRSGQRLQRAVKKLGDYTGLQTVAQTIVPYSAPDLVNPGRGQSSTQNDAAWNELNSGSNTFPSVENGLFPQNSEANKSPTYPDWPGATESVFRYTWRTLQPNSAGLYNFNPIDDMLTRLWAQGRRLTLRVMMLDQGVHTSVRTNGSYSVYSAVPDWFELAGGGTELVLEPSSTNQYVIPLWDSAAYLTAITNLITALGNRYNKDERLAAFEISGLGNWGEWHCWPFGGHYGTDFPWSQSTLESIIDTTVTAFSDTQLLGFTTDVRAIAYQLNTPVQPVRPVGLRNDSLSESTLGGGVPRLADQVANAGPELPLERWKKAPFWFEYNQVFDHQIGLQQLQTYHGSNVMASNIPSSYTSATMPPAVYANWSSTMKYAGYRYAITQVTLPQTVRRGATMPVSITWQNAGVAPTYDSWQVCYSLKPSGQPTASDTMVKISTLNLKSLYYDGNPYTGSASDPLCQTTITNEQFTVPGGMSTGTYDVYVSVIWQEHKTGATHTVSYPAMYLAMGGRTATGQYKLATILVV